MTRGVVAGLFFALGLIALAVSAAFALDVRYPAHSGIEWYIRWRRKAGREVPDPGDPAYRKGVMLVRVSAVVTFLIFGAVFVTAGVVRL
jgi:hypothetical protein